MKEIKQMLKGFQEDLKRKDKTLQSILTILECGQVPIQPTNPCNTPGPATVTPGPAAVTPGLAAVTPGLAAVTPGLAAVTPGPNMTRPEQLTPSVLVPACYQQNFEQSQGSHSLSLGKVLSIMIVE